MCTSRQSSPISIVYTHGLSSVWTLSNLSTSIHPSETTDEQNTFIWEALTNSSLCELSTCLPNEYTFENYIALYITELTQTE